VANTQKKLEVVVNPNVNAYTKTLNQRKILRKTQKRDNLLKTKRILKAECKLTWGASVYIQVARVIFAPLPQSVIPLQQTL